MKRVARPQAEAITSVIDFAIGMNDKINDKAAIAFAAAFYRALGYGNSVRNAFDQGIVSIMLEGVPDEDVPVLHVRDGASADEVLV